MAKRDVDRRVNDALKKLTASREEALRDLASALDKIDAIDHKLATLNAQRTELIATALQAFATAKQAGWKTRELHDAGLTIPAALNLDLPTNTADPQ